MVYEDYESSDVGDPFLSTKANAYNVRRILNSRKPKGQNWFIIGQYLMNAGIPEMDPMQIAELAWQAQNYEDEAPPFGDQEAMLIWDKGQAAREALKRTARKVLKLDFEAKSN